MEGMMACMTYYPRACGSLRVSEWTFDFTTDHLCGKYPLVHRCYLYSSNECVLPSQEKLGAYFLSKMDSDNPKVQEVCWSLFLIQMYEMCEYSFS